MERAALCVADLEAFDPRAPLGGRERRFRCPFPACGGKANRNLSVNIETGLWQCHRCHAAGLLIERRQTRSERQRSAIMRSFKLSPQSGPAPLGKAWDWQRDMHKAVILSGTPGAAYLVARGIPTDLAENAGVLFSSNWCAQPAVIFPLRDGRGELVAAHGRYLRASAQPKARTGGPKSLGVFATPSALSGSSVVVVEAPICALSLALCGVTAVALCGTTAPNWLAPAMAFRRIALGLDADAPGDDAAERLGPRFRSFGAKVERWRPQLKDWNELLQSFGEIALRSALSAHSTHQSKMGVYENL